MPWPSWKKRYEQTIEESGAEIRSTVEKSNSHLVNIREEIPLCPFCENLFEEVGYWPTW